MKHKSKGRSLGNLNLSDGDIEAIVSALPLVTLLEADTPAQNLLNEASSTSAATKLINHSSQITADEIRVISISITVALLLISGQTVPGLPEIDAEWMSELRRYFFVLNRLDPIFQAFLDDIRPQQ